MPLVLLLLCLLLPLPALAKEAPIAVVTVTQRYHSWGLMEWSIGKKQVKLTVPMACLVYSDDAKGSKVLCYSSKTHRYVSSAQADVERQFEVLKTRMSEVFTPWKVIGKGHMNDHDVVIMERKLIKSKRPIPTNITVLETVYASDIKMSNGACEFLKALVDLDLSHGLPLKIERRAFSPKRPLNKNAPFVLLETTRVVSKNMKKSDFEVPSDYKRAGSVSTMIRADDDTYQLH